MSVMITSPILDSTVYAGMTGASRKEKVQRVLIDKLGLGIFGTTLKGKMESVSRMKKSVSFYAGRGKSAYIRFRVNEKAIWRVMQFITYFQEKMSSDMLLAICITELSIPVIITRSSLQLFHHCLDGCSRRVAGFCPSKMGC